MNSNVSRNQTDRPAVSKDTPIMEGTPAGWIALYPFACPACSRKFQLYRKWWEEARCDCGQLLLRPIDDELEGKLADPDAAFRLKKILMDTGNDYGDHPTVYGMYALKEPSRFLQATDSERREMFIELDKLADQVKRGAVEVGSSSRSSQRGTVDEMETAARAFEQDALQTEPSSDPGSPFWKHLGFAAAARLAILQSDPGNVNALLRLYDYTQMHSFDPPALRKVMDAVKTHWQECMKRNPSDFAPHLYMAITTNVTQGMGMNGYPGLAHLKKAASLAPENPDVCVEMAVCLRRGRVLWPWSWYNTLRAKRYLETAIKAEPDNPRAYREFALCSPEKAAFYMLECQRRDPANVWGKLYCKALTGR